MLDFVELGKDSINVIIPFVYPCREELRNSIKEGLLHMREIERHPFNNSEVLSEHAERVLNETFYNENLKQCHSDRSPGIASVNVKSRAVKSIDVAVLSDMEKLRDSTISENQYNAMMKFLLPIL